MRQNLIVKLSFLLAIFMFAGWLKAEPQKTDRIAVIGAGASGLTAAYRLEQLGYSAVTVYEKENRFGGKVYSYPLDGMIYEVGAFWAGIDYKTVDELANRFGVEFVDEEANFIVRLEDGSEVDFSKFPSEVIGNWQLVAGFLNWSKVQKKFAYLKEADGFFQADDSDLYMPFAEFAKKYKIEAYAKIFRPFWIGCGYGYYETTPAMYVLKLMLGVLDLNLGDILKSLLPWNKDAAQGLRRAPDGYQQVFVRVGESLRDARLNAKVDSVRRYNQGENTVIEVTANGQTEVYDYLIVATDLAASLKFLDASNEEDELFSQVMNYNYYIQLVEADIPTPAPTMILLDEFGSADTIGHVTALVNREATPNIWTTGQLLDWSASTQELDAYLSEDFELLGATELKIIDKIQWTYFPHVGSEALEEGFYKKLGSMQGKDNTYYVGGVLGFETVESTSSFASKLILDNF